MALQGKVCVVTGGGRGIGRTCAVEMAAQGAEAVVVLDLDQTGIDESVAAVEQAGATALGLVCDITSAETVEDTFAKIGERFGRVDVLHNNAGLLETRLTDRTRVDELAEEVWDKLFDVNVKGMWLCTKYAAPWLRRSKAGAIVNCGSTSSLLAFPTEACYCTTKAAVLGLTRATALDLSGDGIRCNSYCPTSTETAMIAPDITDTADPDAARRELAASHLVPRLGEPKDVAKLVCFLASDDAAFLTGANYPVDGGTLAWRGLRPAA